MTTEIKAEGGAAPLAPDPRPLAYMDAARGGVLVCRVCEKEYAPTLPAPLSIYHAIIEAFAMEHAHLPTAMPGPVLTEVGVEDGRLTLTARGDHWAMGMLAESLGKSFTDTGAENYVSVIVTHRDLGQLEVTVQRLAGKRPSEFVTEYRQRITELEAQLASVASAAEPPSAIPSPAPPETP